MTNIIIVTAPSGVGKSTILNEVAAEGLFNFSVSMTTRAPRAGEIDGKDYFFASEDQFLDLKNRHAFIETAGVFGNQYGTLKQEVERLSKLQAPVLLELDAQGSLLVKQQYPDATVILIVPPSFNELRDRLALRATESKDVIDRRLSEAKAHVSTAIEFADYVLINDELQVAVDHFRAIIKAHSLRTTLFLQDQKKNLEDFL